VWYLNNLKPGATAPIRCTNNVVASYVDFDPQTAVFCAWEGIAKRTKDRDVKLFDSDGITHLRPRI